MIAQLSRATPVLVQGIAGRMGRAHAALMRAYGTNIVAGVAARGDVAGVAARGEVAGVAARGDTAQIAGIPVFADCAAAVAATGAVASVALTPPAETLAAARDAFAAGIRLLVTVAEGVPVHDALCIGQAARAAGAVWVGASTPGLAIPGELKLGFLPDVALRPGPLGVMSKSGTLSYEVGWRLARAGLGQSLWVGVGGDPVKGVRFADLLPTFLADARTRAIVLVGEIGGTEEEDCAAAYAALGAAKPLFALIAGREAKEGVAMGHAGALVHGSSGTLAEKTRRLEAAGAFVFSTIEALVQRCVADFGVQTGG
ncbi:MAG: succinate--CoA ligase subunit alpha [Rhodospirillales bacterium]|nr:succinate--CoA ligase subunit alpha [Rhodospirillales bacterium]